VCDDTLYVSTGRGLYCLTPSLSTVWVKWPGGADELYSSVAVADPPNGPKLLYVGGHPGTGGASATANCLSAADGDTVWTYHGSSYTCSASPAVAYENAYFIDVDGRLMCFGEERGLGRMSVSTKGDRCAARRQGMCSHGREEGTAAGMRAEPIP
jgi:outer membrane protein assembly factor BamB